MDDKEYRELLRFCTENEIYYFEFYRRRRNDNNKSKVSGNNHLRIIEKHQTDNR